MSHPIKPPVSIRWLFGGAEDSPPWLTDGRWTPDGRRILFTQARTGLHAFLRLHAPAIDDPGAGPESDPIILVPAYIPRGVVMAAIDAGWRVRYYPMRSDLSIPAGEVEEKLLDLTPDAILFVHYFGFPDRSFATLANIAVDLGALVVEDCARALFSRDRAGRLLGSTGDCAIFSLHKLLPVPNGGLLVSRTGDPVRPARQVDETRDAIVSSARQLLRLLGAGSLVNGSSMARPTITDSGQSGGRWPGYAPGRITMRGLRHVEPVGIARRRRTGYRRLYERLDGRDEFTVLTPPPHAGVVPYGLVLAIHAGRDRRHQLYRRLVRAGLPVEVLTWPLVHRQDTPSQYPGAESLRTSTVVLPTHQQLPDRALLEMAAIVTATFEDD